MKLKRKRNRSRRCNIPACQKTATGGRLHCAEHTRVCQELDDTACDRMAIRHAMQEAGVALLPFDSDIPFGFHEAEFTR